MNFLDLNWSAFLDASALVVVPLLLMSLLPLLLLLEHSACPASFSRHSCFTYKCTSALHMRFKEFNVGDYVMVNLGLEFLPSWTFRKLHARGTGSFRVIKHVGPNRSPLTYQIICNQSHIQHWGPHYISPTYCHSWNFNEGPINSTHLPTWTTPHALPSSTTW